MCISFGLVFETNPLIVLCGGKNYFILVLLTVNDKLLFVCSQKCRYYRTQVQKLSLPPTNLFFIWEFNFCEKYNNSFLPAVDNVHISRLLIAHSFISKIFFGQLDWISLAFEKPFANPIIRKFTTCREKMKILKHLLEIRNHSQKAKNIKF